MNRMFQRLAIFTVAASTLLATGCGGLAGTWKVADSEVTEAGFATINLASDGTYTQTGRTDGEPETGKYTTPATYTLDPDFGTPPAGMTGPYLDLENAPDGDGEWVYGYVLSGSSLTLHRYAQRGGMGVRWASALTVDLTAE